jgi:multiple sugar transport system ATP-binding protein
MDEPLSNLDAALRVQTRADIVALQDRLSTTTLYVTHDQVEAMTMGDRIAVMSQGLLQQVATPEDLYARPANTFVAGFLGSPGMNLLPGKVTQGPGGETLVEVSGGSFPFPSTLRASAVDQGAVTLGIRPESLRLDPEGPLHADVTIVELLGAETHVICRTPDGSRVIVRQSARAAKPAPGDPVRISVDPDPSALHLFDATTTLRLIAP